MSYELETAILEGGLKNIHFFEGRLLTARDLREEQHVHRMHRRRLAQAIGVGVARGLRVRIADEQATKPAELVVTAGIGITPGGDVLELSNDVHVVLERPTANGEVESLFHDCTPAGEQPDSSGFGVYLLVVSPASGYEEFALESGLRDNGRAKGCGRRYVVEGVRFRLELVLGLNAGASSPVAAEAASLIGSEAEPSVSKLRNLLARFFIGSEDIGAFLRDPSSTELSSYGPIDAMRGSLARLLGCDLPLAVMHWTPHGLSFVDDWSVRRRPHQTGSSSWSALVSERTLAEGEAAYRQFLQHAEQLAARTDAATLQARDFLRFLPAAGVVPIRSGAHTSGFEVASFFNGLSVRGPQVVPGAAAADLIASSFRYPPIDLHDPDTIALYHFEENQPPSGPTSPPTGSYLVFASRHLPRIEEHSEGPPEIVRLEPAGEFAVGDTLRIVGKGFGDPAENVVSFTYSGEQKTLQTFATGSHEELLILEVPLLTTLPDTGDVVTLSVHNPRGADSTLMLVRPATAVVVAGNVLVAQPTTSSTILDAGVHVFTFEVTGLVNLDETFDLEVGLSASGAAPSAWEARAVDPDGDTITTVDIPARTPAGGSTVLVRVEVTIPDDADGSAELTLTVTAQSDATIRDTSETFTIVVGDAPEQPATITFTLIELSGDVDGSLAPDKVLIGAAGGTLVYEMHGPSAGTYEVHAVTPEAPWTITLDDSTVDTGGTVSGRVRFEVGTAVGAADTVLRVQVRLQNDSSVFGSIEQLVGFDSGN